MCVLISRKPCSRDHSYVAYIVGRGVSETGSLVDTAAYQSTQLILCQLTAWVGCAGIGGVGGVAEPEFQFHGHKPAYQSDQLTGCAGVVGVVGVVGEPEFPHGHKASHQSDQLRCWFGNQINKPNTVTTATAPPPTQYHLYL